MEIACELHASLTKLCRKYHYPRSKVHVQLIQNGKELGGLDLNGSVLIKERLQKLGVCLYCDYHITKVTPEKVEILDAQKVRKTLPSELLIWTAGVRVNPLLENLADSKSQGAIRVNSSLQSVGHDRIFAAGDNAYLSNPRHSGSRFPMLASVAKLQGALVAENIIRIIKSRPLLSFKPGFEWLLLLLGGKFGLFKAGPVLLRDFCLAHSTLCYFALPPFHPSFFRALRKWRLSEKLFVKND